MPSATLTEYIPGPDSIRFHTDKSPVKLVTAPIRSSKSYTILYDSLISAWNNPTEHPVLITAPTYGMLKEILERPMVDLTKDLGLYRANNYSDHSLTLRNGKTVVFRSLENPDRVRGLTAYKAYCDEVCMCSKYAIDVVKGRLLSTGGDLNMITTPFGTSNWVYQTYYSPDATVDPGVTLMEFSIFNNPDITVGAVERLKTAYDSLLYSQDILGKWVNLTANGVYYAFSEGNVTPTAEYGHGNIFCGVDYNLDKNPALLMYKRPDGAVIVFDEIYGSRTVADLGHAIHAKYGGRPIICDDAQGRNRNQSDGRTNRQVLVQCGLTSIIETTSNPRRIDRYANVNSYLANALGQHMLFIHPRCTHLIKDLRELAFKQGTNVPDTQADTMGHASDALGYAMEQCAPHAGLNLTQIETFSQRTQRWLR